MQDVDKHKLVAMSLKTGRDEGSKRKTGPEALSLEDVRSERGLGAEGLCHGDYGEETARSTHLSGGYIQVSQGR